MAVTVRSPRLGNRVIECVVDTGFVGHLTLRPGVVQTLRLPFLWNTNGRPADGSAIAIAVLSATVLWDGRERRIRVLATGARPLLGTLLLDGHTLTVEFFEGGAVSVEPLQPLRAAPAQLFPFLARLLRIFLTVR